MTHRTPSRDACNLVIMSGIAMLTIVRSRSVMKNPSDMTISTIHGLPRYLPMVTEPLLACRHTALPPRNSRRLLVVEKRCMHRGSDDEGRSYSLDGAGPVSALPSQQRRFGRQL